MPKCNFRRCGFYCYACVGSPSDCYCADRMTPKQCDKKMQELGAVDIKELWKIVRNNNS